MTDWESVSKIVGILLALGGAVIAVAKYFSKQGKTIDRLHDEIKELKERAKILSTANAQPTQVRFSGTFEQLLATSTDAAKAVGAAFHSISVPVPLTNPSDLRIILSTDPQAEKVFGREFPINVGLAGWVFQRQEPSFKNPGQVDRRYFDLVDKAADTKTGAGAILTMPLLHGGICRGVIQFMKPTSGRFDERDVAVASQLTPSIARLLSELDQSPRDDIPSVARGSARATTLVFTDITGFSEIAAQIRLEDTVGMLNEYYARLLPHAFTQGGKLEEYIGDGMYLSFHHDSAARAAQSAVAAAFAMQTEYRSILQGWMNYNHPVSDRNTHSTGIATGIVYSGLLGHPQERRPKFVGSAVNLASHLCAAGKTIPDAVLVCSKTKELIESEPFDFIKSSTKLEPCFRIQPKVVTKGTS